MAFAEAITKCGGAGVGSRTMCDATLPAADVFRTGGTLAEAAAAARKGADSDGAPRGDARPVGVPGGGDAARRRRPGARAPWRSRSRPSLVRDLSTRQLAREHARWS